MAVEILPGVTVPSEQRLRVTRVLVFEGPAHWVLQTLEKRWVRHHDADPANLVGEGLHAREDRLTVEVLG